MKRHLPSEDLMHTDEMIHFDRERLPERVIFAKGTGAFGFFETCRSMSRYTRADFLQKPGQLTEVFVRFSLFMESLGGADTVRDLRGFQVKFYTGEGNYDLEGIHLPVFFIRDNRKFTDLVHRMKPARDLGIRSRERFWEFVSDNPETMHLITWLYTDRGTIADYACMDGFAVNPSIWLNDRGEKCMVRYYWKSLRGIRTIHRCEAQRLAGIDPDIASRRLFEAIERQDYPQYELFVQLMYEKDVGRLPFDPLDDTKIWPTNVFPFIKVGILTLKENPVDFFTQVEQSAFSPGNLVPGIELSADRMLRDRSFCCQDAQRYRIGEHYMQIPVNCPRYPAAYRPVRSKEDEEWPTYRKDDYSQAGRHYRSLSSCERASLHENIALELYPCSEEIIKRVLGVFACVDRQLAYGVEQAAPKK